MAEPPHGEVFAIFFCEHLDEDAASMLELLDTCQLGACLLLQNMITINPWRLRRQ